MLKTDKPKYDAERESEATDVDSANRQVGANVPDGGSVSDDEPFGNSAQAPTISAHHRS